MDTQKINYVCIKSYNYKMDDIMKYYNNFFEIIKNCKKEYDEYEKEKDDTKIDREKLISYSRLEILKSNTKCRFFLDVENINENNAEFIKINDKYSYPKFLEEFERYMDFKPHSFTITLNNNSEHIGYSYHIIWPYTIQFDNIKKYIIDFINKNPQYAGFIDSSIYSARRIFRCPYQHKPALKKNGRRINDYHKIIFSDGIDDIDNNLDKCISNSIIQNIFNLEEVKKEINIGYDDINRYNTIYRETKKKESDQLKHNQINNPNTLKQKNKNPNEEDKEPFEQQDKEPIEKKNNITTDINDVLNKIQEAGININNPQDILNLISHLISINSSK